MLALHAKLMAQIVPSARVTVAEACDHHAQIAPASAPARMSWACLLERVFNIDTEHCPRCGAHLQINAAIEDPQLIVKILTQLGLPARTGPALASAPNGLTHQPGPVQPLSRRACRSSCARASAQMRLEIGEPGS